MVQPNFAASWLSLRDTIRCYGLLSRSMPQKMWSAKAKKIASASLLALLLITVLLVGYVSRPIDASARGQFLRFVPADTTSVAFIDFDELRSSPFLASLFAWAPHPTEDSEYASNRGTDQAFQADPQQTPLEDDNSRAQQRAYGCVQPGV